MTGAFQHFVMPVVSSTLPCLGAARPGRRFSPPKATTREWVDSDEAVAVVSAPSRRARAPAVEILELIEQEIGDDDVTRTMGTVVCGYRIGPLVARGGLSVLFEVTHPTLGDALLMKVITDRRIQHDLAAEAIYVHAEAIAKLESPHVVRTFDAGRLPTGEPFVIMEQLDGEDLEQRLRKSGPLAIAEAVRFVMQACEGLAEAHAAGIVHGDVKPGNLLIARGKRGGAALKVIDFAPSVPRVGAPDDPLVTCSPGYASPEQLGARPDVDGRADVFALGAVLYELVTGKRAFEASNLPDMLKVIGRVPPSMRMLRPEASSALDIIVRRCLARDREARFGGALELRDALAAFAAKELGAKPDTATARGRAAVTAKNRLRPPSRVGRTLFLAALGPASALASMTLVRLVMASNLVAGPPPPPRWPDPPQLTSLATPSTPSTSSTSSTSGPARSSSLATVSPQTLAVSGDAPSAQTR
jgi:serine/threonine protein kinase